MNENVTEETYDAFMADLEALYDKHGVHIQAYEMHVVELKGEYTNFESGADAMARWQPMYIDY